MVDEKINKCVLTIYLKTQQRYISLHWKIVFESSLCLNTCIKSLTGLSQGKLPFTSDWSLNKQLPSHYICSVVSYQTKTKKLLFPTFCHFSPSFLFYIKITFLPSQKRKSKTKQKNQPTSQKYHYTVFYLSFLMF